MPRNLLIRSAGFRNLDPQTDDMEDRNMLANTICSKIRSHEFLFLCWFPGYSFCLPVTTTTTIHQNLAPQISRHHHVKSKVSCVSACFCFVSDLRRHSYGSKRKANLKKWFKKNRKGMTQAIHSLVLASINGVINSAARASIDGVIDSACGMAPSNQVLCRRPSMGSSIVPPRRPSMGSSIVPAVWHQAITCLVSASIDGTWSYQLAGNVVSCI